MLNRLDVVQSSRFKKSYKRYKHNKEVLSELEKIINLLRDGKELPARYRDHRLKGDKKKYHECHVKPDTLLLYFIIENETLKLVNIGSHAELFNM